MEESSPVHSSDQGSVVRPKLAVISPVYNDWACLPALLDRLDQALHRIQATADMYLIDDASALPRPRDLQDRSYEAIRSVWIVRLKRNLGHQRAIAVGLGLVSTLQGYQASLV